jgi:hypothetical protein
MSEAHIEWLTSFYIDVNEVDPFELGIDIRDDETTEDAANTIGSLFTEYHRNLTFTWALPDPDQGLVIFTVRGNTFSEVENFVKENVGDTDEPIIRVAIYEED